MLRTRSTNLSSFRLVPLGRALQPATRAIALANGASAPLASSALPTTSKHLGQRMFSSFASSFRGLPKSPAAASFYSARGPTQNLSITILSEFPGVSKIPKNNHFTWLARSVPKTKQVPSNSKRAFQRGYRVETAPAPDQGWKLVGGLAAVGIGGIALYGLLSQPKGTVAGIEGVDTVGSRIRATYGYVAGGLATTAIAAMYMFQYGVAQRLMMMNPWLLLGASLLGTVGTMLAIQAIPPENKIARHLAFGAFNLCIGATLSPLGFLGGPLVMKAMAATGCVVGSLSLIAATAPNETFLWMGAPLGVGLGVILAASVGQMFFPASALLANLTLYGGLGIFSLFVLYDTQKVKERAEAMPVFDPMTQSLAVYMDTINIFVRVAQMMAMSGGGQNRRK